MTITNYFTAKRAYRDGVALRHFHEMAEQKILSGSRLMELAIEQADHDYYSHFWSDRYNPIYLEQFCIGYLEQEVELHE